MSLLTCFQELGPHTTYNISLPFIDDMMHICIFEGYSRISCISVTIRLGKAKELPDFTFGDYFVWIFLTE
jgi:hypothetical protein